MSDHTYHAGVVWQRQNDEKFTDNKFSRAHTWSFDEGLTVPASASPYVLPPPLSRLDAVDPEEALLASLSSCHMLFFLYRAARAGLVVERYEDVPEAVMDKTAAGRTFIGTITLKPLIVWAGPPPSNELLNELHEKAHTDCYIGNSLTSKILIEPRG